MRRRHDRRGRVGAHAAGVGARVAVADALVILRRRQRQRVRAVDEREEARLLALEEFLDHDLAAGLAERAGEAGVDRGLGFCARLAMMTPLPAASPSALTTIGQLFASQIGLGAAPHP